MTFEEILKKKDILLKGITEWRLRAIRRNFDDFRVRAEVLEIIRDNKIIEITFVIDVSVIRTNSPNIVISDEYTIYNFNPKALSKDGLSLKTNVDEVYRIGMEQIREEKLEKLV